MKLIFQQKYYAFYEELGNIAQSEKDFERALKLNLQQRNDGGCISILEQSATDVIVINQVS
ncbi:hypothetical protein H1P_3240005 [Hyella patelloides LEGE 07179]|uniref:Uncharacterized protein n=1 Tax=Hyella patelloides LEGE 07179 TaxID=945734 RepID=A0A563VVK1_9CYAN|nr:hypothetical protein [Hyella patelloides]VEP15303.1 hypothetical protein H1P_3240005 [Hyella patelloides LEGE 07179]